MSSQQDRLIHWLLGSLAPETTLFHLGQYCGSWQASTSGLARAGFHLVLHGDCWLHLPEEGAAIPLKGGDGVFFLRDLPHRLSPHADPARAAAAPRRAMAGLDPCVPESVGLACGFFSFATPLDRVFLDPFPDYLVISPEAGPAGVGPLFDLILAEARGSGDGAAAPPSPLIARLVGVLFFYVIRHLCARQSVRAGLWALLGQPAFAPLLDAILQAPGRDWSVMEMAQLACLSRATFYKRFVELAGATPSHVLLQIRMQHAARLIGEGHSLARTAEQVGYQSEAAFSRAFKKATGVLPGAYRRGRRPAAEAGAALPRGIAAGETNEQKKRTFAH